MAAQTDVVLGGTPYGITATETNPVGFSLTFCYQCTITPTGLASIVFNKDSVTISALQLDCTTSLTDAGFVNLAPHPYNSAGSSVTIANGYTDFFTHTM